MKHFYKGLLCVAMLAFSVIGICMTQTVQVHAAQKQTDSLGELASQNETVGELTDELAQENTQLLAENESVKVKWSDNYSKADLRYLSSIIYCEARSLNYDAKIAVGNVVLNRMNNTSDWGHVSTIKEVIYDKKWGVQFSPAYSTGSNNMKNAVKIYKNLEDYEGTWQYDAMVASIEAAKAVLEGEKVVPDTFLYFNGYIDSSREKCENRGKSYLIIEGHIYF